MINQEVIFYRKVESTKKEGTDTPWLTLINGFSRTHSDFKVLVKNIMNLVPVNILLLDNRGVGRKVLF